MQFGSRAFTHLGISALAALTACTEPDYGPADSGAQDARQLMCEEASNCRADASTSTPDGDTRIERDAGEADGSKDASGAISTPADALPGLYALRFRFYGADTAGIFKYAQEIVALGEIARDAKSDELQLVLSSWCDDHAITTAPAALDTEARMVTPTAYPARAYTLDVTGDTFQTSGDPVHAGWVAMTAEECPAGSTKPSSAPWRSGTCTCPSITTTPTSADDCRVIDSDGDQKAGFTVRWSGGLSLDHYAARTDSSQLLHGKIDVKRQKHSAQYFWNHDHRPLTCSGPCPTAPSNRKCTNSSVDVALFEPITNRADWTCDAVKRRIDAGSLFFSEQLLPIAGC